MRKLALAFLLLISVTMTATAAAPNERDGSWLINGIRQYERNRDRQNQSFDEAMLGVRVTGYIRGVLDKEMDIVLRASFNIPKDADGKVIDMKKLGQTEARKLYDTNTYFAPLWKTRFLSEERTLDQDIQIIKNYLEKHPDRWNVPAVQLIEEAMLEALPLAPAR
jgi:hypothetical protein